MEIKLIVCDAVLPQICQAAGPPESCETADLALCRQAAAQLDEYLAGRRLAFDFPYALRGTEFQLAVWEALLRIPYGETASYKDIAAAAGRPGACRAAGQAVGANPLAIVVPCHRAVGSGGRLGGYAPGLGMKKFLLDLEKRNTARKGPFE